jgi:plasmid stabilization system protein ParE
MRVVLTRTAVKDLQDAYDYIASDSISAAENLLSQFDRAWELLESGIVRGRQSILKSGDKVESWPLYPYRIYYLRLTDKIEVLRVYHLAREPIEQP